MRPGKRDETLRFCLGVPGRAYGARQCRASAPSVHDRASRVPASAQPEPRESAVSASRGRCLGDRLWRAFGAARARLGLGEGAALGSEGGARLFLAPVALGSQE